MMAFTRFAHTSHKLLLFCLLRFLWFYKNNSDNKGLSLESFPPAAESSANQTRPIRQEIKGKVPIVYLAIARGSPWVVPLLEKTVQPSVNRKASER